MVPAPGEPGSETWPAGGDQWKTGGAATWVTGNYDAETNLLFWGTGNGGPWMGDQRPGDNLYSSSTVAIDATTGQIKGHFQYQPNESWDWDEVSPPILVDFQRNGRTDQGSDQRRTQRLPLVPRAHARKDQLHRRQAVREAERVQEPRSRHRPSGHRSGSQARNRQDGRALPVALGRQELAADRVQPGDADDLHSGEREYLRHVDRAGSRVRARARASPAPARLLPVAPGADHFGEVQAWNVDTGQRVWTHDFAKSINWGPMLVHEPAGWCSAAGPTIGCSGPTTPRSGKVLWEFPTNSGVLGTPTSFVVDGTSVRRRAVRLGRRRARRQRPAERLFSRRVSRGARRRLNLGLRSSITGAGG